MKIYIIIINVISILSFLPCVGAAVMSPMIMAAAARDSSGMPMGFLGMITVALLPVVLVIAQYYSWKYYFANNLNYSLYYACLPLIWIGLALLLLPFAWFLGWAFSFIK